MSKIHGKDTKPEVLLRKELWHMGWRYRKNFRKLPGSPDIVMTKYRLCIFVDSEFFHGKGFYGGLESKKYESLEEQLKHSNHPDYWLPKSSATWSATRKWMPSSRKMAGISSISGART